MTRTTNTIRPADSGFTLIEMIITIVITSVLAALAALIILQGVRAYSDEDQRSNVHYQARLAVERIAREARMIPDCASLTLSSNPTSSFSFIDSGGASVTFSVSDGTLYRGGNLLASGITSTQPFSFYASDGTTLTATCPSIWYIDIDITDTEGSQSLQIKRRVRPRNFL